MELQLPFFCIHLSTCPKLTWGQASGLPGTPKHTVSSLCSVGIRARFHLPLLPAARAITLIFLWPPFPLTEGIFMAQGFISSLFLFTKSNKHTRDSERRWVLSKPLPHPGLGPQAQTTASTQQERDPAKTFPVFAIYRCKRTD